MFFCYDTLQNNFNSFFPSQIGTWYAKGLDGWVCIVVTSFDYPNDVAVEAVDELCARFLKAKSKWFESRRNREKEACSAAIVMNYGTLKADSAAQVLMTQVDEDVRREYSKSIRNLMDQVEEVKNEMQDNILELYAREERLDRLAELSEECLEQAKLFKKQAKDLHWKMWVKNKRGVIVGTTLFTAAGAATGFLIRGPGGAALFTCMESVVAAEVVEASLFAALFAGGFLGAASLPKRWFWSQPFQVVH